MKLWCCKCHRETDAQLVSGMTVNVKRPEGWDKKYFQCPTCLNYCGAQKRNGTWVPIAFIASPELRAERQRLHELFDPVWQNDPLPSISRKGWYDYMTFGMNRGPDYRFHFGFLRSFRECKRAETLIKRIYKKKGLIFPRKEV